MIKITEERKYECRDYADVFLVQNKNAWRDYIMIVYVKECSAFNINKCVPWFKKTNMIRPLNRIEDVNNISDIIVISNTDNNIKFDLSSYNTMVYEEFYEKILINIVQECQYNYDYYYLKNALLHSSDPEVSTLISGSSYGVFGVDTSLLFNAVNLSSISQDLYYSLKLIYSACETNKNVKNIVLCLGYYYFFSDLSKTQNTNEIRRISNVYKPLFNDIHNCPILPPKQNILYESAIFDIPSIIDIYTQSEYIKGFFNQDRPREKYATKEWDDKSKNWNELNINEKIEAGKRRADQHNRSIKRKSSFLENISLFQDFLNFCGSKKMNLILVVTPATPYYLNCLLPEHKFVFYYVLNEVDGVIHLLDLSDDSSFSDCDFNDTDHLNDSGARKLTTKILSVLQEIDN